jgi:argininosuccinate lyase
VANLLGFDGVLENSMDAVSARDFLVEATAVLASLSTHLSGLAEDLVMFSNKGYIDISDDYASTSSIMPQKKNPDTLELVRACAGDASAGLSGLLTTLKGLPRAYNRDLQRAHDHAFRAIDAVTEATEVAAGAVATADWQTETLAAAAGEGFSTATGVADLLAMHGVPFRTAHELVARGAEEGADYAALDAAAREVLGAPLSEHVDAGAVEAALDPESSVASRDSLGGPAPEAVEAALERVSDGYETDESALETRLADLAQAETRLAAEVRDRA